MIERRLRRWGTDSPGTHCREGDAGCSDLLAGTDGRYTEITNHANRKPKECKAGSRRIGEGAGAGIKGGGSDKGVLACRDSQTGRQCPAYGFTSLAHRIDVDLLRQSYRKLSKSKASGVDKVTSRQYEKRLMENIEALHQRLSSGRYRALPVKRVWKDKEDGRKRPIGIPSLEDKIVQRAVATLLETVTKPSSTLSHTDIEGVTARIRLWMSFASNVLR
jgi:hypothetical protein